MLYFEWDEKKNRANFRRHRVWFEESKTVFHDPDHSGDEERFVLLGMSEKLRLLVVCHIYDESDEIIRIFSARKANKDETKEYRRHLI